MQPLVMLVCDYEPLMHDTYAYRVGEFSKVAAKLTELGDLV